MYPVREWQLSTLGSPKVSERVQDLLSYLSCSYPNHVGCKKQCISTVIQEITILSIDDSIVPLTIDVSPLVENQTVRQI